MQNLLTFVVLLRKLLAIFFLFTTIRAFAQPVPLADCGEIIRIENFSSSFTQARNVDIWLPANYDSLERYAVLYMHDGQMLFDSAATWNKQSWNADEVACRLLKNNKIQNFILVGIWNSGTNRHRDYFPQKPFGALTVIEKDSITRQLQRAGRTTEPFQPDADNYLKFIVNELKPYIDKHYAVYSDARHTFMAGSSMGGLISIYGICEYPEVFGGVACMSTHWPGTFTVDNAFPAAFLAYLKANMPSANGHKIYFDCGDQGLDALYPPLQEKVDALMKDNGFGPESLKSLSFKNKDHNERSWNERLDIPFVFLLGK